MMKCSLLLLALFGTAMAMSHVRFMNTLPTNIDVSSGSAAASVLNLAPRAVSNYAAIGTEGEDLMFDFAVNDTTTNAGLVSPTMVFFNDTTYHTIVIYKNDAQTPVFADLSDDATSNSTNWSEGMALIRLINLTPASRIFMFVVPSGPNAGPLFSGIQYLGNTAYALFDPSSTTFRVEYYNEEGTGSSTSAPVNGPFVAGNFYTVVAFSGTAASPTGSNRVVRLIADRSVNGPVMTTGSMSGSSMSTSGATSGSQETDVSGTSSSPDTGVQGNEDNGNGEKISAIMAMCLIAVTLLF
eukprot:TRINITY_DN2586_c0_g1_i1.p1 TRINITY_DN2586_c0_g1~~TRINITY_DN2586_c0_g1_i1.p1  ORF type:complete len:297 (+),score=73.22 TRINITY_DN2586_c0_g1_i1:172-1062(+)